MIMVGKQKKIRGCPSVDVSFSWANTFFIHHIQHQFLKFFYSFHSLFICPGGSLVWALLREKTFNRGYPYVNISSPWSNEIFSSIIDNAYFLYCLFVPRAIQAGGCATCKTFNRGLPSVTAYSPCSNIFFATVLKNCFHSAIMCWKNLFFTITPFITFVFL